MNAVTTTVLVINGLPGSGKSTLAARLRSELRWPLFAKDVFKERLLERLGSGDREWSRRLSSASFDILFECAAECVQAGCSVILEGNFRRDEHGPRLLALAATHAVDFVQVLCHAEGEVLMRRFRERASTPDRDPAHRDLEMLRALEPELRRGRAEPLALPGPLLELDTTRPDLRATESLVSEVLRLCARAPGAQRAP